MPDSDASLGTAIGMIGAAFEVKAYFQHMHSID